MNTVPATNKNLHRLVFISMLLAIVVIGLGAFTRLTHAGLGCPDWPTCYGLLDVPVTESQIAAAEQAFPERPVETQKAWNEMIHRYFAGCLGLLIAVIAFLSFKLRLSNKISKHYPLLLPFSILAIVTFQAALGMWTVTLKLMPIIVMLHLLGGFTTLCLLFLLYLRLDRRRQQSNKAITIEPTSITTETKGLAANTKSLAPKTKDNGTFKVALIGIAILTSQIALGGWTSANYAAMSCIELPICQGNWLNDLRFENTFDLIPPVKESYEFGHLSHNERLTIHVFHRFGAIVTTVFLLILVLRVFQQYLDPKIKKATLILTSLLLTQVALGVSNIWFSLPLYIAVSHNLVAVLLMLSLISLTYKLKYYQGAS